MLGDREELTVADFRELRYCMRCVNESMRLYPHPPVLLRRANVPDTLPGALNSSTSHSSHACFTYPHRNCKGTLKGEGFHSDAPARDTPPCVMRIGRTVEESTVLIKQPPGVQQPALHRCLRLVILVFLIEVTAPTPTYGPF